MGINTGACVSIKSGVDVTVVLRRKGTQRSKKTVEKGGSRLYRVKVNGRLVVATDTKGIVSHQCGLAVTVTTPVVEVIEMSVSNKNVRNRVSPTRLASVTGRCAQI